MKFRTIGNTYITIDSARMANWIYHYMTQNEPIPHMPFETSPQRKAEQVINRLSYEKYAQEHTTDYVRRMLDTYDRTKLFDDELAWINKNDKRLIFWLWAYLRFNLQREVDSYPPDPVNGTALPDVSQNPAPIHDLVNFTFKFNYLASSNQERYDAIIFALEANNINGSRKREFLSQLKVKWKRLVKTVPKLTWIIGDPEEAGRTLKQLKTMTKSAKYNKLIVGLRFDLTANSDPADLPLGIQAILDFYYVDCSQVIWHDATNKLTTEPDLHQLHAIKIDTERAIRGEVVKLSQKLRKAYDERAKRARERKEKSPNIRLSTKAQYTAELISLINRQKPIKIIETLLQQELDRLVVSKTSAGVSTKTQMSHLMDQIKS